jgi:O-antigen/teichoic acid export membrane protein
MGYTKQGLTGFLAHGGFKGSSLVFTAIKIAILARLLTPTDFGMFAMVAVVLGITESLTETGINTIIVQSHRSIEYYVDSAWVISILRGFIIGIVMLLGGLGLESLMNMPGLAWLIAVAACVPILKGFINPAIISFYKNLRFGPDAVYRLSLVAVETVAAIGLAWVMRSPMALILSMATAALFEVVVSFVVVKVRPRFLLIPSRVREIWNHASRLNASAILSYLLYNVDNVLVGRFLGSTSLGFYQNAFALAHKPNLEVAKSAQHSLFPIFATIHKDASRLQRGFWRSLRFVMIVTIGCSLPMLIAPNLVVRILLGEQWLLIVPWLWTLVIAGIVQSGVLVSYTLFVARREYSLMNVHLGVNVGLLLLLLWLLMPSMGIPGAALSVLLSRLLSLPLLVYFYLLITRR